MRKFLLVSLLLALAVPSFAQFGSNTARRINSGTAAPPATCSSSPVDAYVRTGATLPTAPSPATSTSSPAARGLT